MDTTITLRRPLAGGAVALFCLLVGPVATAGAAGGSGAPEATASASVKKQVKKLKKQVKRLQAQLDEISPQPGPAGPRGEKGDKGDPGLSTGPAGGDLTGNYPDPNIAPNAVGTDEVDGTLTGADIDESTLAPVPSATTLGAGHTLWSGAYALAQGETRFVYTNPFPLELSCPGGEAMIRVSNGTGVQLVSFRDDGGPAPTFEVIDPAVNLFSSLTGSSPSDFFIWQLAPETDVQTDTSPGVTFFIGVDENDSTNCDFYVQAILTP